MIALFTDYGLQGPYVGQLHVVLRQQAPGVPVIDLMHDAPAFAPRQAAYLLAALVEEFPVGTVFLGVVDPGVGGPRRGAILEVDGRWFVGPDNGLFNVVAQRGLNLRWWDMTYRPARLSASFHGRDLFAPVSAMIALGARPPGIPVVPVLRIKPTWPEELGEVIYIDGFGNVMIGIRMEMLPEQVRLAVSGEPIPRATRFSEVPVGSAFWYANSSGLVEIAVNQGSAAAQLGLVVGDTVAVVSG
ncbi:MAG: S-adenosyl-l-methionine hydroxide adenosyltransferase family protein [Gammaproteobacteria bacterium]